jgi:uncharacterized protein YecE (DUF72 family)
LKHYVGCSGWSYSAWLGHFYPKGLEGAKYLAYYGKVFDYVEIDSSFYRIPNQLTVSRWAKVTSENFRFTAKMPQVVTHERRLGEGIDTSLRYFYEAMTPLQEKLLAILIQLPPSLTMKEGLKKLKRMPLDTRFKHAIEARHKSLFDGEVYDYLKENDLCLAWSQLAELQTPPVITTDFIYLRLIGDRSIPDSEFGKIQKDRINEMEYWANEIKKLTKEKKLKRGVVAANNHYAGFGPGTANTFRTLIGMQEVTWHEKEKIDETKQKSMLDFSG